jgi:hypothetical protein
MLNRLLIRGGALLAALILTACGGAATTGAPSPTATQPATPTDPPAPTAETPPGEIAASPTPESVEATAALTLPEGFPTTPSPIDSDFRDDPARFVAATGRPQVIEFFTWW